MERIDDLVRAREKLLDDITRFLAAVHLLSGTQVSSVGEGIQVLRQLRVERYEELNQIQHEHTILIALDWLTLHRHWPKGIEWFWNPRQTGDANEPDLRAVHQGQILASAEITTSEKPVGTIDTRMRSTLEKLSRMDGEHFYFVRSNAMRIRADSKVSTAGWNINVVQVAV